ncbi:transmembrane and ubiquitin-like domain-containing protein 1 [Amblyraja radiata]|uniref:transmembrane and ubiquitin-like domain-containing protein 1 n=1 Tax=Amblyraja radiata TaxID=386614 RepID=UPI00140219B3|nr:transmembrane and ubiquitin-like domain-containing protein 1 [Amblyraja radiata]
MALIEGVGDEVTLLFSLVFIMMVLALAWASTRTVDRGEQTLPPTQSTSTDSTEQSDSACPSCQGGSPQPEAGDRRSDGEEGGKQRDRVERKKDVEGERQSDGVEGERQADGEEGGRQRDEAERDKQRNGEGGEQRRDDEEGERQRDREEREGDRVEGERQEEEKRSDTERQFVAEREETSPAAGAAENTFPDDVPVEVRQRGSAARVGDDEGEQPPHTDCAPDSPMLMRLKFLNETERIIQVRPEQTIGYIKRTQFPQQEHQVRLIYQGQLLGDDTQTLSSLHISSNCVVHCHISQNATPQSPAGSQAAENTDSTLNIGGLMLPLFFLMLSILWYYQINYRHFFTVPATISLVGITILFSFVAFGAYRR